MENCNICINYIPECLTHSKWCYKYKAPTIRVKDFCKKNGGFEEDIDSFHDEEE